LQEQNKNQHLRDYELNEPNEPNEPDYSDEHDNPDEHDEPDEKDKQSIDNIEEDYGQDSDQKSEHIQIKAKEMSNLAPKQDKFELHDSDVEKDKDDFYEQKLLKIEQEIEDKYDFDIPDFEPKPKEKQPKPDTVKESSHEEIDEQYSHPNPDDEPSKPSMDSIHRSELKESEKEEDIEDYYGEEFEKNGNKSVKQVKSEKLEKSEKSEHREPSHKSSENGDHIPEDEEQKDLTDDATSQLTKKKKKHMNFDILKPKSLRVLYDMTYYLGENQPEDLFNDKIFEQLIKTKKKESMVELIEADDFFSVLLEHSIIKSYEGDAAMK
jgi:hypothetical protein